MQKEAAVVKKTQKQELYVRGCNCHFTYEEEVNYSTRQDIDSLLTWLSFTSHHTGKKTLLDFEKKCLTHISRGRKPLEENTLLG